MAGVMWIWARRLLRTGVKRVRTVLMLSFALAVAACALPDVSTRSVPREVESQKTTAPNVSAMDSGVTAVVGGRDSVAGGVAGTSESDRSLSLVAGTSSAAALGANGEHCDVKAGGSDCKSGNCVDGLCCQASSCGQCQRCGGSGLCETIREAPDDSCDGARSCNADGVCVQANGTACMLDNQCHSGICYYAKCCAQRCDVCRACNGLGDCTLVQGGDHPSCASGAALAPVKVTVTRLSASTRPGRPASRSDADAILNGSRNFSRFQTAGDWTKSISHTPAEPISL